MTTYLYVTSWDMTPKETEWPHGVWGIVRRAQNLRLDLVLFCALHYAAVKLLAISSPCQSPFPSLKMKTRGQPSRVLMMSYVHEVFGPRLYSVKNDHFIATSWHELLMQHGIRISYF